MIISAAAVCLALNIYHEARGEPLQGQLLVAEVTLNRAHNRDMSVCDVVYQPHQFSWTNDGKSDIPRDTKTYNRILEMSEMLLLDRELLPTTGANYFHTRSSHPAWDKSMRRVETVGNHIFYTTN